MKLPNIFDLFKSNNYKINTINNNKLLSLGEIHLNKKGYVSDKWDSYLEIYDEIFAKKRLKSDLSLLEIGVQNGGSLQTWATFFPKIKRLIGCDINPNCSKLIYESKKINIVIGNIIFKKTINKILKIENQFDIIIDDGSHLSSDIIITFLNFFKFIKEDGIFVVEDLHCSYWNDFEGGLNKKDSANNFFKKLSDVVNMQHWMLEKKDFYDHFSEFLEYDQLNIDEIYEIAPYLHSVEFRNSLCILRKKNPSLNVLGNRIVAGKDALVDPAPLSHRGKKAFLKKFLKKNLKNI